MDQPTFPAHVFRRCEAQAPGASIVAWTGAGAVYNQSAIVADAIALADAVDAGWLPQPVIVAPAPDAPIPAEPPDAAPISPRPKRAKLS